MVGERDHWEEAQIQERSERHSRQGRAQRTLAVHSIARIVAVAELATP